MRKKQLHYNKVTKTTYQVFVVVDDESDHKIKKTVATYTFVENPAKFRTSAHDRAYALADQLEKRGSQVVVKKVS